MGNLLAKVIMGFNYFVGVYYGVANIFYTAILITSFFAILRHLKRIKYSAMEDFSASSETPPVTIIIPAYNEEELILGMVESSLSIEYPFFEVIVVNDGSDDGTLDQLRGAFGLKKIDLVYRMMIGTQKVRGFYHNPEFPGLLVIDKERGGKGDALNCGINASKNPYFCSVDADSILERSALLRLATPVIESPSPVIASGGVIRVLNGNRVEEGEVVDIDLPENRLATFQIVEYLRAFLFGRAGLDAMNGILILSGAFSLFNKASVMEVGGFDTKNVTEDMEMVVRLHEHSRREERDYTIKFISDPICWTEVPGKISELGNQRKRWHMGLMQTLSKYRSLIFNPRYGRLGTVVIPYYLFIEMISPAVEIFGYLSIFIAYALGLLSFNFLFLFLTLAIFYGIFLSCSGIFLEELTYRRYPRWSHFFTLLLYGVLENFGYRQLNSLWRVQAIFRYIMGKREWDHGEKEKGKKEEGK